MLAAFALGAIPLSMNLVGIRVLNAFENTRYQFISTLITNLFAIIASLIFFTFWKPEQVVIGLAFAFAISYWVGLFVTDTLLAKFTGGLLLSTELGFYLKVSLAAGSAVALVAIASRVIGHTGNFIELILVLISTTILYLLFAKAWRIREVSETLRVVLRRGK